MKTWFCYFSLLYIITNTCHAQKVTRLTPYELNRLRIINQTSKPISTKKKTGPFTLTEAINQIRSSIVRIEIKYDLKGPDGKIIEVKDKNGKLVKRLDYGSGFFLNDSVYVATNHHVIASMFNPNAVNKELFVAIGVSLKNDQAFMTENFNRFASQVVAVDKNKDLAILLPIKNPFKAPSLIRFNSVDYGIPTVPKFSNRIIEDGVRIAASGYPLEAATLITSSGYVASSYPANGRYEMDMRLNPGNSGGPVYLVETGEIIGVAVSVGMLSAELRFRNGTIMDPDIADSLYIEFHKTDKEIIKAHLVEIGYFYNSGLSQVINLNEVVNLAQQAKILIKLGPAKSPKKTVASKPKPH